MSKEGALKVLDPPLTASVLADTVPAREVLANVKDAGKRAVAEVRQVGLRTEKTAVNWWRKLPNDGVRAAIVAGAALIIGLIPTLAVIYRKRSAP